MDVTTADPANAEQTRSWDGTEGAYWARHAERFDATVARYHEPFLDAAALGADEHVLDIGCGTGQTTRDAARRAGEVLGVDLSKRMIDLARRLAADEGVPNARFVVADAQVYPFPPADVAISRTGAMFFGDPVAAFANIGRALRPGSRLVLLTWQAPERNEWLPAFATALTGGRPPAAAGPGPFSLADPARVQGLLAAAGFVDVRLEPRHEPMWFGPDPDDAHDFVLGLLGWMLDGRDASARARAEAALRTSVQEHHGPAGVQYDSAAWIVTARRDG